MFKLNSLAACSSPSDPKKDRIRDVVDLFGVDAVREVLALIWGGGLIEPMYKAIVKSLTWWDGSLWSSGDG